MSNILEKLHDRRRLEVELKSGLKVGYHLPDVQELIVKVGQLPLPAVQQLQAADSEELTDEKALELLVSNPDTALAGYRYTQLVVATMLDDIDGEAIDATDDREAIVAALDPADRQELFEIGTQQKADSGEA